MTFAGLYMYDRAKAEVARGERKVDRMEYKEKHLLPLDTSDLKLSAPPTPDPYGRVVTPVSATSTTEKNDPARRRSSSITGIPPPPLNPNWNLGSIQEMTPPITPRNVSPQGVNRPENRGPAQNGHRRRYSGSTHNLGAGRGVVNGVHLGNHDVVEKMDFHPEAIEEKASWE